MKRLAQGLVHERVTAIADITYPAYLIRGDKHNMMIDAGMNHLAPAYLASLKDLLGDTGRLDYLLLTHSHYDHVGSAGYLKRHIPGLKLGAHERAASLAQKQSALDTMNRLSASHDELAARNVRREDLTLHPFHIDILLKQGDVIDLGGLTCTAYETPGHTRDSLTYHFPEMGALFPGDACGVLRTGPGYPLQVEFLSSYQDYVDSIRHMISLEPEIICLAHNWVLSARDAMEFLERSLAETFRYREMIETYLDGAEGDFQRAVHDLAQARYGANGLALEPTLAQLTNLTAQVKLVAEMRG